VENLKKTIIEHFDEMKWLKER